MFFRFFIVALAIGAAVTGFLGMSGGGATTTALTGVAAVIAAIVAFFVLWKIFKKLFGFMFGILLLVGLIGGVIYFLGGAELIEKGPSLLMGMGDMVGNAGDTPSSAGTGGGATVPGLGEPALQPGAQPGAPAPAAGPGATMMAAAPMMMGADTPMPSPAPAGAAVPPPLPPTAEQQAQQQQLAPFVQAQQQYIQQQQAPQPLSGLSGTVENVSRGDLFRVAGRWVRLFGLASPEADQMCMDETGRPYACGQTAIRKLRELTRGKNLICRVVQEDAYGNVTATCSIEGAKDLGAELVESGWAIAYRQYSTVYIPYEENARGQRAGLWVGQFYTPWDWNAQKQQMAADAANVQVAPLVKPPTAKPVPAPGAKKKKGIFDFF